MKQPVKLTELIDKRTRRWRIQRLWRLQLIRQKWPQAAGEYVAEHTVPVRLVRKTLRISVDDSTWLNEMNYLKDTILERLQASLPGDWIKDVKLVVGEPPETDELVPAPPDTDLPEPTSAMRARVEEVCSKVADADLSEKIGRAMLSSLRLDAKLERDVDKKHIETSDGEQS